MNGGKKTRHREARGAISCPPPSVGVPPVTQPHAARPTGDLGPPRGAHPLPSAQPGALWLHVEKQKKARNV